MDSFKKAKIIKWLNYSQYFLIFITCTLILVYEISVMVDKYLEKNTGTGGFNVKFDGNLELQNVFLRLYHSS